MPTRTLHVVATSREKAEAHLLHKKTDVGFVFSDREDAQDIARAWNGRSMMDPTPATYRVFSAVVTVEFLED